MKLLISFFFLVSVFHFCSASDYATNYAEKGEAAELKILTLPVTSDSNGLSYDYYYQSCPNAEAIISRKVKEWIDKDRTLAASILRLHFHDCVIKGCDGSILLNHEGSERSADVSKTLRGFEVIDDIKAELEKNCSRTVSCADILTSASRDATVFLGGSYWMVPYGRKDGKVSIDEEADKMVPNGHEDITSLIELFQSKGLNLVDLVILSVQDRLYNYQGTGKPDSTLPDRYLNFLTRKCRWASEYIDLDATSPTSLGNEYYKNLQKRMGLLSTDQLMYFDPRTQPLVNALAYTPQDFYPQLFGVSMTKLGNIVDPEVQQEGEIRTNCNYVNSY
ncbi:hypothetical protein K2173_000496 [Erythroxylum novogranatense]|uniref:Peroxidase n=1 Tax=Erythroxylum novogranatense TaxID=1862640 RepID=A0AAV8SXP6_9ROSI|nr:hypothetical protein K2173_000496 [Erythroxylum novogranatense]